MQVNLNDEREAKPACERCGDQGWYWRTPEGFNPFLAGGFSTARAMYRAECSCARTKEPSRG